MINKIKQTIRNINNLINNDNCHIYDAVDDQLIEDELEMVEIDGSFKVKYKNSNWWIFDDTDLEHESVENLFQNNITVKNIKGEEICYLQ